MSNEHVAPGVITFNITPAKEAPVAAEVASNPAANTFAPVTNHATTTAAPPPEFVQNATTPAKAEDAKE